MTIGYGIIHSMRNVIGWDIGGVNTKVARVLDGAIHAAITQPFEIQRDPDALVPLLADLSTRVGASPHDAHGVTMTAELSQMFRTKRDGVAFVIRAITTAFPTSPIHIHTVDGMFGSPDDARNDPLGVAASNWAATARIVADTWRDAILIDVGTTTSDIIAIANGRVVPDGYCDPARLASGELVYTGALRTPTEAITTTVPLGRGIAAVSAEGFALIGDVHVWRGDLAPRDYTVPTPDGRPATREFAGERIARIVCADREILDDRAISSIATAVAEAQLMTIGTALERVRARHPNIRTAVVAGLGAFIGAEVARRASLDIASLSATLGHDAARAAPAAAVALLLERYLRGPHTVGDPVAHTPGATAPDVAVVVKVGGGLLAEPARLDAVLSAIARDAGGVVVVPGGGPFADAVRELNERLPIDDHSAHWMAVLAMDQYAHLIASRHPRFALVTTAAEARSATVAGVVPVVAPWRWLSGADPLPHGWQVTSDSISAWIAGQLHARRLVLIKPPGARGHDLVDDYFATALPCDVAVTILPADDLDGLRTAVSDGRETA